MGYLELFLCALVIEVGWVAAVRAIETDSAIRLAVISMSMQAISYASTLILVHNSWTMLAGITGSGIGAAVGLRVPATWFRRGDPSS